MTGSTLPAERNPNHSRPPQRGAASLEKGGSFLSPEWVPRGLRCLQAVGAWRVVVSYFCTLLLAAFANLIAHAHP